MVKTAQQETLKGGQTLQCASITASHSVNGTRGRARMDQSFWTTIYLTVLSGRRAALEYASS